jgi:LPXTG-motif cell wall-anchored protein
MDTRYTNDDSDRRRSLLMPHEMAGYAGFGAVSITTVRSNICKIPGAKQVLSLMNQALKQKSLTYYKNALNSLLAYGRKIPLVGTAVIPTASQVKAIWTAADGFSRMCSSGGTLGAATEDDSFWDPTFLRVFATSIDAVHTVSPLLWTGAGVGATGGTAGGLIGLAGAGVGSIPGWVVDIIAAIVAATTGAANVAVLNKMPDQLRTTANDIEKQRKTAATSSVPVKRERLEPKTASTRTPTSPSTMTTTAAAADNKLVYAGVAGVLFLGGVLILRRRRKK